MRLVITDEFSRALDLLNQGENLFLTGKAGTGKSTLIRHFMENNTDRNVVVAAPTGVAALNVDGYTLHRLFSFPAGVSVDDVKYGRVKPARFSKTLKALDTLIVDEASMVRADLFDAMTTALEKYGPEPGEPLGGVQLVLVGDLYQLPPVVHEDEKEYFSSHYRTPYFFSAKNFDRELFPTVALTRVFRQQGDTELVDILNAIRDGRMTRAVNTRLNAFTNPDFLPPPGEFWLTLATTNRIVGARNRRALESLEGVEYVSYAETSGDLDRFDAPTEAKLSFKIGAQIMLLNNDYLGRWVNGSLGTIVDVVVDDDVEVGKNLTVYARLRNGEIVEIQRHTWEITRPSVVRGALSHDVVGTYEQLPFKLAWAITIHKSQGQTLDRAVIDLSGGTFSPGQLYVALSRCTSLDGLVLARNIYPRDVKVDHRIRDFLKETTGSAATSIAAVECLLVGQGDGYIRPIDIAIAFPDGTVVESLINPTRDLGASAQKYGLSASDLQIAPTLTQAWPFIEDALTGHGLVSSNADAVLEVLDTELKRTGQVTGLESIVQPLAEVDAWRHQTAASAARETLRAYDQAGSAAIPRVYEPLDPVDSGYQLTRDFQIVPYGDPQVVADMLANRIENLRLSKRSEEAISRFEEQFGVTVPRPQVQEQPQIEDVLSEGVRVCFTGTAHCEGRTYEREEMEEIARTVGLVPVKNVTKTKCDVLVAADVASMSNKAKAAAKWGKPVFSAAQFLGWARV